MGEMDTDTIGLIVLIAAVLAVHVAGKLQARKARQDAAPPENHVWRDARIRGVWGRRLLRRRLS
jgi:hypothetical protein